MAERFRHFTPPATLRPVKLDAFKRVIPKGNTTTRARWWRVNLGKRLTGTEKVRKFFSTEKAAKDFIADVVLAAQERGRLAFMVPHALAVEAMELDKQLASHGATLTDAVKFYLRHVGIVGGKTVEQLLPDYLRTKENPDYRKHQGFSLRLLSRDFGQKPISAIQAPAIDKWLKGKNWKPLNMRNHLRDVAMFFKWAKFQGHIAENPCDKIRRPKVPRSTPAIFNVDEARRLLETAAENPDLQLLPMYAICLFAGVRIAEVRRMKWEMIDWDEGEIRLPGQITKTGNARHIDILDGLRVWVGNDPPKKGEIVSLSKLQARRKELFKLAGVPRKRNGLRHSFASYHAAKFRDPGTLQLLLGQETPSVLFRHYVVATKKSDAKAFFALRPNKRGKTDSRPASVFPRQMAA